MAHHGAPEGLTEHRLNASGLSSLTPDDATYARAACLAAAAQRAQFAAFSRRSMEDWRRDQRCGPDFQQAEKAPSTSTVVQAQPETSVRVPWAMSPQELQMQNQAFHDTLQPHAPTQAPLAHEGHWVLATSSSQVVLGHVLPMLPPPAEVDAPEGQRDDGGCRSKAAACVLCCFSSVLLAAGTALVFVPHRILAHQMPHSLLRWKLPIILASAMMLFTTGLFMRFFRKSHQQSEGLDQASYPRRKRRLIALSVALGLVLIKGAMLAAHGDLHMPGFMTHHHGHHHGHNGGVHGDGDDYHYGDGDGDGNGDGYGDSDGDGDGHHDEEAEVETDGDVEGKGEGGREGGREYFGDSGVEGKQDYEDNGDGQDDAGGNGNRVDDEGEDDTEEENDDQEDSEGEEDGNDNMISI
jgi:membrane protein implicated in regulation of membrane protease activity